MKLPLLLALLFGAVSALHLRSETSYFESLLGAKTLPKDEEMPEQEVEELEAEEEGGSGSEDASKEDGAVESISVPDVADKNLPCPKEEDTVQLMGVPGRQTCRRYLLVRSPQRFNQAQLTCQRCYRGNLVSIHSFNLNSRIHLSVRGLNQGQVWIGGRIIGSGRCRRFWWVDGSHWNFAFWAAGQPSVRGGRCVALCTRGGHWRRAPCNRSLPFVCSY
ncbi:bone marrow proteoglycan isoform X1 [Cebus imitator]|uniref:Proteoglycan 2, pro eosinophil major basic protein n=1 Tax=Cebus imitator TaxID=2715852 RepID=A0A2K5PLI5_CEBIM|nr:bone marrow proteoglycan isoform X1 [Cebus imitator]XP_037583945.1 bone marrow proteoglycan isoform X1 [Cebus imitator]XP_037583946.1 bone marrow proteoglycan isoform X1 [Cebus imitator]XP_037583947.1 bone marrow proteoglycan isoform X1 [Cebus imitator]